MTRVAFPSYDVQTSNGWGGGIGSFIVHFARQLRARGDDVTIIAMERRVDPEWRDRYRAWGIRLIEIRNEVAPERSPKIWPVTLSEHLTPLLREFDVVYFCDAGNIAFNMVRLKHLGATSMPVCVTVLHGSLNWVLHDQTPTLPDHLYNVFAEQYSARHSDLVIAPSRYMAEWVGQEGWHLDQQPQVAGLPFIPLVQAPVARAAGALTRLVYFARLQPLKGFDLFVRGLLLLHRETPDVLASVDEVVFLGHEDVAGAADRVREELRPTGLRVSHIGNFDSRQAQAYLASHVTDTLVVIPSAFENFPYAVIEASLIPGLNIICTRGGGTPEIFAGRGDAQLFNPTPGGLAAKIRERLSRPLKPSELVRYDFSAHNARWLRLHEQACRMAEARTSRPAVPARATVDVCVTYSDTPRHFPQLLRSLELQTFRDFRVIAIDRGSATPHAAALFDYMAEKYADRGWLFVRGGDAPEASRDRATRRSTADYLLFVEADDILAANAIERLVEAAESSGDDCLTSGVLHFSGDQFPFDPRTGRPTAHIHRMNMPLGTALAAAVLTPTILGGDPIFIRRSAFEAVSGFPNMPDARLERRALLIRLAGGGYRTDVVPEYLLYSRHDDEAPASDAGATQLAGQFDAQLAAIGLEGAAATLHTNQRRIRERRSHADLLARQLQLSHERFNAFGFEPLAISASPAETYAPPRAHGKVGAGRKKQVLVVIPTLHVGGAEMDLLRTLPRIDRSRFGIVVFAFLDRGKLAPLLVSSGVDVVGPYFPFRLPWPGYARRAWADLLRKFGAAASRVVALTRQGLAALAPDLVWNAFQRISSWLRLRRKRLRAGRLRKVLRSARQMTERVWQGFRTGLAQCLSALAICRGAFGRLVPGRLKWVLRDALVLLAYTLIGVALVPFMRRRKVDLIHAVLPNSYMVGSIASIWMDNCPLIMSRVGLNAYQRDRRVLGFVERRLCHRNLSAAVGNCDAILDELRDEGIAASRLRLVRNGIDVDDFTWRMIDRNGARLTLGLSGPVIALSVVAGLHAYKGHDDLLRALHSVRHDMPNWVLLVAGRDVDGNRARLQRLAEELGSRRHVVFLGERTDVPAILSAADIHVSCSHTEGAPNNILEAMCARLPVVATAVGGVAELVIDRETGMLVPPHDPDALGQAILALARSEELRQRMGSLGRAHVAAHFAIDRSVNALSRLYSEVTESGRLNDFVAAADAAEREAVPDGGAA